MATISDVAKQAGVSTATVSHVINGSRYVSPEIKERVTAAINKLGYKRDAFARGLRSSKTDTIGLVISDITNPYFSEIYKGVYEEISKHNEDMIILINNTDENPVRQHASIANLMQRRIDGLILAPSSGDDAVLQDQLTDGVPTVLIDRFLPQADIPYVVAENTEPARDLTTHLIGLGHRRIAVMQADLDATSISHRMLGYAQALEAAGIAYDSNLIHLSKSDIDAATQVASRLLDAPDRPTAVLCTNDFMVLGLFRALTNRRLRCPDDVAVVGFDDFPWADTFSPKLTVASLPTFEIGRRAAQSLIQLMRATGEVSANVTLPTQLMLRESCGRLRDQTA